MPTLTLIGYRGTGKSTIARLLAERLGVQWRDTDDVIEERLGRTITTIIHDRGEAEFRDAEAALLTELLATFDGVLATGGGIVLREANRRLLAVSGRPVIWLTASADTIRSRLAADPTSRGRRPPLAGDDPIAEVEETLRGRESLYRSCADWMVDTSSLPPDEVAAHIDRWLHNGGAAPDRGGTVP